MTTQIDKNKEYNAQSIRVLKGLEAVRKNPGMYIGDITDPHNMPWEVIDNGVDEHLAGYCTRLIVTINKDGSMTVKDNGRGIPIDIHAEEGVSAAEVIMTQLHAGGKFDGGSYKVSGGLHGVGVSVVNALSEWLDLEIQKNGGIYFMRFLEGVPTEPLKRIGDTDEPNGTKVTFKPSQKTFTSIEFSRSVIEHRLRELAFLNPGLSILFEDLRDDEIHSEEFSYEGGICEFAQYIDKGTTPLHEIISISADIGGSIVDIAIQWNDTYHETYMCFTNNIRQRYGGTHLTGFRMGLPRVINNYAKRINANTKQNTNNSKQNIQLTPEDMREGLTCIISIKLPYSPVFSSQTKDKLVSEEVRGVVESALVEGLDKWLEARPDAAKAIMAKIYETAAAREAAKKARESLKLKDKNSILSASMGKIASCQSKDPQINEIFLVEGDSAGGTAKQGRDRRYQAILPLRGKILNVERSRFDKILNSNEICTVISALGTGIGEDFNIEKLKYHKIIIMTDADVDGAHIRTLLLTFFYRYMPQLIENGHIYIARPPLYKITRGKTEVYLSNEDELQSNIVAAAIEHASLNSFGVVRVGRDLEIIVKRLYILNSYIDAYASKALPRYIFEILLISGYHLAVHDDSDNDIESVKERIMAKLGSMNTLGNIKWDIYSNGLNVIISKVERGVNTKFEITPDMFSRNELEMYIRYTDLLRELFMDKVTIERKNSSYIMHIPSEMVGILVSFAMESVTIQRFKGLGEMLPDQLWNTTLNPDSRILLKVNVENQEDAHRVFSVLMGEAVEARRDFIQSNALKANVDA